MPAEALAKVGNREGQLRVNHLVLHMFKHNRPGDLRAHHALVIDNHAVALVAGLPTAL